MTGVTLAIAAVLTLVSCSGPAPVPPEPPEHPGFLHAEGKKIVDGEGEEVLLRGMGLGGWMLQEGYMMRTGGPQHRIEERIEALVGAERTREFYAAWLARHTTRADIEALASWGFDSVRLPMHYALFTPPIEEEPVPGRITWRDPADATSGFRLTDALLDWAAANEIHLILDLHAAPGGQGKNADINDYDPEKPSLWESEANREKTVALWRKLAERYADHPWIGGYDILNEPNWGFTDLESDPNGCAEKDNGPLWDLLRRITEAIREVDPNHLIFLEGNCWGNNYASLPPLWDDNLAISFHKYWNFNDPDSIQWVLDLRDERDVPIWLGESGENSNVWFTDAIALVESHGIGWAWWPLKKQGFNNPLEIVPGPGYQRLAEFWRAPVEGVAEVERPTADEAFDALMRLTEKLRFENNVVHRDVVDAMIRQPHTDETVPWKHHRVSGAGPTEIRAVDYDLGRHGHAYGDTDTANYRVSTGGPSTPWNHGRAVRNDGVDLAVDPETGPYVGWIEDGEWLQYTLDVEEEGRYAVSLVTSGASGAVSLKLGDEVLAADVAVPETRGDSAAEATEIAITRIEKGPARLRVLFRRGGFRFQALTVSPRPDP